MTAQGPSGHSDEPGGADEDRMLLRAICGLSLALPLTFDGLSAQRPDAGESPVRSRVERQVEEMRRQVVEGRVFRSHVRVTVRLKNGNRIRGIVKDGVLVERVKGPRFVAAERDDDGAGIRLYYYNGNRNYVFLPFREIKDYRIDRRITALELAAIERASREREQRERREQEAAAALRAATSAPHVPVPAAPGAETQDPVAGAKNKSKKGAGSKATGKSTVEVSKKKLHELYVLLQTYPPQNGWNAQRRDEIKRRFVVVGALPTAKEQEFVKRFAEWQQACSEFGVKPTQEPQPDQDDPGSSRRRRSNRQR